MAQNDSERVFTPALLAFLLAVIGVVSWAIATRHPAPDLEGCIELLGDGDLMRGGLPRVGRPGAACGLLERGEIDDAVRIGHGGTPSTGA